MSNLDGGRGIAREGAAGKAYFGAGNRKLVAVGNFASDCAARSQHDLRGDVGRGRSQVEQLASCLGEAFFASAGVKLDALADLNAPDLKVAGHVCSAFEVGDINVAVELGCGIELDVATVDTAARLTKHEAFDAAAVVEHEGEIAFAFARGERELLLGAITDRPPVTASVCQCGMQPGGQLAKLKLAVRIASNGKGFVAAMG